MSEDFGKFVRRFAVTAAFGLAAAPAALAQEDDLQCAFGDDGTRLLVSALDDAHVTISSETRPSNGIYPIDTLDMHFFSIEKRILPYAAFSSPEYEVARNALTELGQDIQKIYQANPEAPLTPDEREEIRQIFTDTLQEFISNPELLEVATERVLNGKSDNVYSENLSFVCLDTP